MPLERRVGLRSRRVKPRRVRIPRCQKPLCRLKRNYVYRVGRFRDWCEEHIYLALDIAVRAHVHERDGERCQDDRPRHVCKGGLQWAHGISRRYTEVRWEVDIPNTWLLCEGAHTYYTNRPEEWTAWMIRRLGVETYQVLLARAMGFCDEEAVLEREWSRWVDQTAGLTVSGAPLPSVSASVPA